MHNAKFEWTVIGAGPAGITAIAKLLEQHISPKNILWIDPQFKVGDFGSKWRNVSSNSQVKVFLKFLRIFPAFDYDNLSLKNCFAINHLNINETCNLQLITEPLQIISDSLRIQVESIEGTVDALSIRSNHWQIQISEKKVDTRKIILAIGSEPKYLNYPNLQLIPLSIALDGTQLASWCKHDDRIAVIGSSHSAITVLRNLLKENVDKVFNFYRSPLKYAVELDDEILFNNTGLKGKNAEWAQNHLESELPAKLNRIQINQANMVRYLPQSNKIIYAIGFSPRKLHIEGIPEIKYNPHNGIIAPGLFGFGIAFPQLHTTSYGYDEYRIGLWKFACYINQVMPLWMTQADPKRNVLYKSELME